MISSLVFIFGIGLSAAAPTDPCPVIEVPTAEKPYTEGCEWKPTFDDRYCIVGYECVQADPTTPKPCPLLNPWLDSVPHPDTERGCETGQPGWTRQEGCQCDYIVSERSEDGRCVLQYQRICKRLNKDGTLVAPCPELKIELPPDHCVLYKAVHPVTGCFELRQECDESKLEKPEKVEKTNEVSDAFVIDEPIQQDNRPPAPPPPPGRPHVQPYELEYRINRRTN